MDHMERRSRTEVVQPRCLALCRRISNRQFPVQLENAVTHGKQTHEVDSNRHFWEGVRATLADFSARAAEYFRPAQLVKIADFCAGA
jgi:hypothetical protein